MSIVDHVKPHAEKLRACAAGMEAAGIGLHAESGHVAVLRKMADRMEADAQAGRTPHTFAAAAAISASASGGDAGLAVLAAGGTTVNGMDQHALARIEAQRITDPGLARLMRDLKLEAGAGSFHGRYTATEVMEKLEAARQRLPDVYRNVKSLDVKLKLGGVGLMANAA